MSPPPSFFALVLGAAALAACAGTDRSSEYPPMTAQVDPPVPAEPDLLAESWAEVARMLTALGGQEAWADLRRIELRSVVGGEALDKKVELHIWRDLAGSRVRIEQTSGEIRNVYVWDGNHGWIDNDGSFETMPPEQLRDLEDSERRGFFRLLRLLARGEVVRPRITEGRRLEIYDNDAGGVFLAWIELGDDDLPHRYGYSNEIGREVRGLEFLEWGRTEGYVRPEVATDRRGAIRYETRAFLPNATFDAGLFRSPR